MIKMRFKTTIIDLICSRALFLSLPLSLSHTLWASFQTMRSDGAGSRVVYLTLSSKRDMRANFKCEMMLLFVESAVASFKDNLVSKAFP